MESMQKFRGSTCFLGPTAESTYKLGTTLHHNLTFKLADTLFCRSYKVLTSNVTKVPSQRTHVLLQVNIWDASCENRLMNL